MLVFNIAGRAMTVPSRGVNVKAFFEPDAGWENDDLSLSGHQFAGKLMFDATSGFRRSDAREAGLPPRLPKSERPRVCQSKGNRITVATELGRP